VRDQVEHVEQAGASRHEGAHVDLRAFDGSDISGRPSTGSARLR
jgi:hypothetical protein